MFIINELLIPFILFCVFQCLPVHLWIFNLYPFFLFRSISIHYGNSFSYFCFGIYDGFQYKCNWRTCGSERICSGKRNIWRLNGFLQNTQDIRIYIRNNNSSKNTCQVRQVFLLELLFLQSWIISVSEKNNETDFSTSCGIC